MAYETRLTQLLQKLPEGHRPAVRKLHGQLSKKILVTGADEAIARLCTFVETRGERHLAGLLEVGIAAAECGKHGQVTQIFNQAQWALPESEAHANRLLLACKKAARLQGVEVHEGLSKFLAATGGRGNKIEDALVAFEYAAHKKIDPGRAVENFFSNPAFQSAVRAWKEVQEGKKGRRTK